MEEFMSSFYRQSPKRIVEQIRNGDNFPTQAIVNIPGGAERCAFRTKLAKAGLMDALLDHLQKCGDHTFSEALPGDKVVGDMNTVPFPTVWCNALMNTVNKGNLQPERYLEECRIRVAQRMDPLIECMCRDTVHTREFFKDKDQWISNTLFFAGLLSNLVLSPCVVPILAAKPSDMVRKFVVQSLFFEMHRSDLVQHAQRLRLTNRALPDLFVHVQQSACSALQEFADVESPMELKKIADMAAVDPDYYEYHNNSSSSNTDNANVNLQELTFATGILDYALTIESPSLLQESRGLRCLFYCFERLRNIIGNEGFGPGALVKLVEIGNKQGCKTMPAAVSVALAIESCAILPTSSSIAGAAAAGDGDFMPNDKAFAKLIGAGLLEMFIQQFRVHDAVAFCDNPSYLQLVDSVLKAAGAVALEGKSCKAILASAPSIQQQIANLKRQHPQAYRHVAKQVALMEGILHKARSVAAGEAALFCCRWCQTTLTSDEVLRCATCKRSIYCSRECQVKDWKEGGHKQECKLMMTNEARAEASGASKPAIRAQRRSEQNLSVAGQELFSSQLPKMLLQATLRGYNIVDCVTVLDFQQTPPSIETVPIEQFLLDCENGNDAAQFAHNTRIVKRNQNNKALTVACVQMGYDGRGAEVLLKTFAPSFQDWSELQMNMAAPFYSG